MVFQYDYYWIDYRNLFHFSMVTSCTLTNQRGSGNHNYRKNHPSEKAKKSFPHFRMIFSERREMYSFVWIQYQKSIYYFKKSLVATYFIMLYCVKNTNICSNLKLNNYVHMYLVLVLELRRWWPWLVLLDMSSWRWSLSVF